MSITSTVAKKISSMPKGKVFGYDEIPTYSTSPGATVKAISRMLKDNRLKKLSKGKFYVPAEGIVGPRKPSDNEIIRTNLYKNGKLRGYVTGLSLYNKLGLTTQVPRTITISRDGSRQKKGFGTIAIKNIKSRCPIEQKNIKLLQYLDVLKDIKKIPDADVNESLKLIADYIMDLSENEKKLLAALALKYYSPQVKALMGLVLSRIGLTTDASRLKITLNPTTAYKLGLDPLKWPMANEWNIK